MHTVIVNFTSNQLYDLVETFSGVQEKLDGKIFIVQRGEKDFQYNRHFIDVFCIKDEYEHHLRWWQNPEQINEKVGSLNPDIVHIMGLNLPLHFRWIKHYLPEKTRLLAEHFGENTWAQKNLWLQQFGLRVVDGFLFQSQNDAQPWIKCAAILDKQSVFIASAKAASYQKNIENIYNNLYIN